MLWPIDSGFKISLKHGDNMNSLKFIDYLPPATDAEIIGLEDLINVSLPEAMKSIYKKYNGGQSQPSFVHDEKNTLSN